MSILVPAAKTARIATLEPTHKTVNTLLSATPQTATTIAASAGITVDQANHALSLLVDEGLAVRSTGTPATATYTAA